MKKISDYSMIEILKMGGIKTAQTGNSLVCKCPICKGSGDFKRGEHNAQVNNETLHCFSENKTYARTEIIKELDLFNVLDIKKWDENYHNTSTSVKQAVENKPDAVIPVPTPTPDGGAVKRETIVKKTVFEHKDLDGKILYKKERIDFLNENGEKDKKIFYKEKDKDQPVVFYGLETIIDPDNLKFILFVEGEKCAMALRNALADTAASYDTAVLSLVKSGEWENIGKEAQNIILSKNIVIFQDNDETGKKNTAELLQYLNKTCEVVNFFDKDKGYDIADWLEEGGELREAIKKYSKKVEPVPIVNPEPRFKKIDILKVVNGPRVIIDFVLPGLPKKTCGMIIAAGGTGKSMLSYSLSAIVSAAFNNINFFDNKQIGKVSIFAAEDPIEIIELRLQNFWATIPPAKRQSFAENLNIYPILGENINLLDSGKTAQDITDASQGSRLIILDTLSRFHSGEENARKDAAQVMRSLEKIGIATGAAVLVLHHVSKAAVFNGQGDLAQAGRGSSVFVDESRWVAFLKNINEKETNERGITKDVARNFVKFGCSKINYDIPFSEIWLKRGSGGILEAERNLINNNNFNKEIDNEKEYIEESF